MDLTACVYLLVFQSVLCNYNNAVFLLYCSQAVDGFFSLGIVGHFGVFVIKREIIYLVNSSNMNRINAHTFSVVFHYIIL